MSAALQAPDMDVVAEGVVLGCGPAGWRLVADGPVLILIGLTGVGKSTAMSALRATAAPFSLLPNRRELTDRVILPRFGQSAVADRRQRFALTRHFAQLQPGGMASILARLSVDLAIMPGPLVFDGLRGAAEVAYAAAHLPKARFLVLTAPDFVRMVRLVLRNDAFDAAAASPRQCGVLPETGMLSSTERFQLEGWIRLGAVDPGDVHAKLGIITTERRNYDSDAAIQTLIEIAPDRSFVVDTSALSPPLVGGIAARLLAA